MSARFPAVAALLLTMLLGGCLEFEPITEPSPSGPRPAAASVYFLVEQGFGESRLHVLVQIVPGRTVRGERIIGDDRLWIGDVAVVPERFLSGQGTHLRYSIQQPFPATATQIRLPAIDDTDAPLPTITVPLLADALPDTVRLVSGADLAVAFDPIAGPGEETYAHWRVTLVHERGVTFSASGFVAPPQVYVIPGALIGPAVAAHPHWIQIDVGSTSLWRSPAGEAQLATSASIRRAAPVRVHDP